MEKIFKVIINIFSGKPFVALMGIAEFFNERRAQPLAGRGENKPRYFLAPHKASWSIDVSSLFHGNTRFRVLNGDLQFYRRCENDGFGRIDVNNKKIIFGPTLKKKDKHIYTKLSTPALWNNFIYLHGGVYDLDFNQYMVLVFDFRTGEQIGEWYSADHIKSCEVLNDVLIVRTNSGIELFDLNKSHQLDLNFKPLSIETKMQFEADPILLFGNIYLTCLEGIIRVSVSLEEYQIISFSEEIACPIRIWLASDGFLISAEGGVLISVMRSGEIYEKYDSAIDQYSPVLKVGQRIVARGEGQDLIIFNHLLGEQNRYTFQGCIHGLCAVDQDYIGVLAFEGSSLSFRIMDGNFSTIKTIAIDHVSYDIGDDCLIYKISHSSKFVILGEYGFVVLNILNEKIEIYHKWKGICPGRLNDSAIITDNVVIYKLGDEHKMQLEVVKL